MIMMFGPFSEPLGNTVVSSRQGGRGAVTVIICGGVDGVDKKCNGGKGFLVINVVVTKKESMEVGKGVWLQIKRIIQGVASGLHMV